jgi:hypothetical protein
MDTETRGLISEMIEENYEKGNVLETTNWVLQSNDTIESKKDFALGYIIGSLIQIAINTVSFKKFRIKAEKIENELLRKSLGNERAKQIIADQLLEKEALKRKGGRTIDIRLTEEELHTIRSMLLPMIAKFQEKISIEESLGK